MVMEDKVKEDKKQFKIAIPLEMKRWLAIEAAKNMRSQSAEVLVSIRERMERQEREKSEAPASETRFALQPVNQTN